MIANNLMKVLHFDGEDDYLSLPQLKIDYSQGFTLEAWVSYDSFKNWSRIFDFGNGVDRDNIVLGNVAATNAVLLYIKKGSDGQQIVAENVLAIGQWTHLAATVDSYGSAKIYKNGEEVMSGILHLPQNTSRSQNYIGRSNWSNDRDFEGKMVELRLWKYARTQAEIQAGLLQSLGGNEPGLAAYWPLNEGSGNLAADKSGQGNQASIYGATWEQETNFLADQLTLKGQFEVSSTSETGFEFINRKNQAMSYTFSTSGTWTPDMNNPSLYGCSAEGFPSLPPDSQITLKFYWPDIETHMKYPQKTPFALLAESTETGAIVEVGKTATIVLNPGETLRFILNDTPFAGYADNSGSITVNWSALNQ